MPLQRPVLSSIHQPARRAANPQSNKPASTLPTPLDVLLPECSKYCVLAFIADNYPSAARSDISTLCTTHTTSGFTLGEATLICESAYCAANGQIDKSIFSICEPVSQAIRPSHSSLTVVPMATSQLTSGANAFASALPPTIGAPATSAEATKITSAPGTSSISATANSVTSATLTPSSSSSTATKPSLSSTSAPESLRSVTSTQSSEADPIVTSSSPSGVTSEASSSQGSLNTGQIVGISLAAVAIVAFIVGLALFLYRRRKERNNLRRGSRWSETIEKPLPPAYPPRDLQLESGVSNAGAATPDHSQRFYAPPTTKQEKRRSFWRRSIKPEDIGVAVSPELLQPASPASISSQRTISQLLPEPPTYSLWPAPLKTSQNILPASQRRSEARQPATTLPSTFIADKKSKIKPRIVSQRTGNGLPTDPRAQMYKLEAEKGLNSMIPLTPVYDNGNIPTTFGAILGQRDNPGPRSQFVPQVELQQNRQPRSKFAVPMDLGPATQQAMPPTILPGNVENMHLHHGAPLRRNSSASDVTSFEDDEDVTPEEEKNRQLRPKRAPLSPVLESPHIVSVPPRARLASPLKDLTYPSPPRSAAVSRQAERQAKPRAAQTSNTTAKSDSRRPQLILDERSFFTTSSPNLRKRDESSSPMVANRDSAMATGEIPQGGLRLNSTAANASAVTQAHIQGNDWRGADKENTSTNLSMKTPPPKHAGGLTSPPVWTPRLTPTRRGEDLYLSVE